MHWNGAAWSQAASPSPGGAALLHGVSASPDGSAWAAGDTCASGCGTSSEADRTLILRWDGVSWSQTASPSPGSTAFLYGVSAGADGSAWAVGYTGTPSGADRTLILRWDGLAWSRVASPSPGRDALLLGVSAGPGSTAWAVGDSCMSRCGTASAVYRMLILHWDGKAWSLVTGPGLGSDAYLYGVSAGPGGSAWAVGYICTSGCHTASEADQMLILRWDGTSWSQAAAPGLGSSALLDAVSAGAERHRLGGRQLLHPGLPRAAGSHPGPDPALGRHRMVAGGQPQPGRQGHPHRRERRAGRQRLGGRLHLHAGLLRPLGSQPDADHALERRHLVGRVRTRAAKPPHLPQGGGRQAW